jgi:chromosome segregation ATPase
MKESYSDFSIVKNYIELKAKYETEVRSFIENAKDNEEKFKKHVAALETEIVKRNEHIKALDAKIQDLAQKLTEKDEQMKTMGLQLHKLRLAQAGSGAADSDDPSKKGKFGIFK